MANENSAINTSNNNNFKKIKKRRIIVIIIKLLLSKFWYHGNGESWGQECQLK